MRRGEIWLYNADPTVGDEISKTRPCIIVNNDDIGTFTLKGYCTYYRMERSFFTSTLDDTY